MTPAHPCLATVAPPSSPWRAVRNVLAVRVDNLGDVLMTTPALRAIRQSHPDVRVTLLTSSSAARALPHLGDVDDAIAHDASWVRQPRVADAREERRLVDQLAERRFDAAVIFTVYTQSALPAALLCRLAGIPLRLAHCRENPYALLTDWVRDPEPEQGVRHEVRRQLDLVASVGWAPTHERLGFRLRREDYEGGAARLVDAGLDAHARWIVLHVGATAPSRRYPPELFRLAAQRIGARTGLPLVFTGSADEAALVAGIRRGLRVPSVSLAGRLSVGEMGAIIGGAALLVSNNTGPVHVAAALGTPVVDLYALTNPQHTPWQTPARVLSHDVECRGCARSVCPELHHRCLRGITPDEVADAACELLAGGPTASAEGQAVMIPVPAAARPAAASTGARASA